MENGWIKLWRNADQHELLSNDNTAFVVFFRLLMKVDKSTGTYKTGRKKLATELNLKQGTLRGALDRLRQRNMIVWSSTNKMTTFSICNWQKFQSIDANKTHHQRQRLATKQEKEEEKEIINTSNCNQFDRFHVWVCELFEKDPVRFKLSKQRREKLRLRLKELGEERLKTAFTAISKSEFHRGNNDRGWKIDTDPYWLVANYERAEKWSNTISEDETPDLSKVEIKL